MSLIHVWLESNPIASVTYPSFTRFVFCADMEAFTAPVPPQPDKRTQAMQLHTEGYTATEIARMTDAKYSTVQSWLRRANAQTNGKVSA